MDPQSVDRIRSASFSLAVRGYDRQEVDRFLGELADWLEGEDGDAISDAVRAELERIGEQTANILTEAHDAGETIRADAEREVRQKLVDANLKSESLRSDAEAYAEEVREDADAYARKVRGEADSYAHKTRADADSYARGVREEVDAAKQDAGAAAKREAQRIVEEANRRRREIETVISDLEQRRDAVLNELEKLASGLAGTATEHRGAQPAAASDGDSEPRTKPKTAPKSK